MARTLSNACFFIVFSSATFLHWCLFFTWSAHIGERPNHKVISVWTEQGLPGQSPPCGVTQGCGIFEARSLLSSHQVVTDPLMILAAMFWTHYQVLDNFDSILSRISWMTWSQKFVLMLWLSIVYFVYSNMTKLRLKYSRLNFGKFGLPQSLIKGSRIII